jgi:Fic family protein
MMRHESVVITAEMLSSIAAIDEFKGAWRALGRLAPERLGQLRKVATIESVGSSTRIEGSRLSDQEVEALLSRAREEGFATRDEQEVAGYAGVMDLVFESFASIAIDERHLMQLHRVLLAHSTKDERHRGRYKSLPNPIEEFDASGRSLGVVFETATPFETPRRMDGDASPADRDRDVRRGVSGGASVPGRERSVVAGADDAPAAAGGV